MQKPELLVLDEPFANLDPTTQIRLKSILKSLKSTEQLTTLISSHDLNHVTDVVIGLSCLKKD
jgi:ABC-2 type transport system ATP-binding protein